MKMDSFLSLLGGTREGEKKKQSCVITLRKITTSHPILR